MSRALKILEAARREPTGLRFVELVHLVEAAGFELARKSGSHRVYKRAGVVEIINLQPKGKDAKPYQVRQVLELIERYGIAIE